MPIFQRQAQQTPDAWRVFGHSYFMYTFGTRFQNGRADSLVRAALDIEYSSWQNWAVNGAQLNKEGYSSAGVGRIYQGAPVTAVTAFGAPFVQYGGGSILAYGINDVGVDTTQLRATFVHSLRTAIAWLRGSSYYDVSNAAFAYSASWATTIGATREYTASTVGPRRTGTASQTMTFTIPTGFTGGAVSFFFVVNPGVAGGTLTLSGTATPSTKTINGTVGGTSVVLSNFNTSGSFTHNNAVIRVAGLTAANAGQTLIFTVSQLDAGGFIDFDGAVIESENPGPVLVCNISHLTATGYSIYPAISANSLATNDAIVDAYNTNIASLVAEFDSMVAVVDLATVMDSTGTRSEVYATDGLHPNERGAALIADACLAAMQRIYPSGRWGKTAQLNTPSARWGSVLLPRRSAQWYTSDAKGGAAGTAYALVAGDVWAIPFIEVSPASKWIQWCVEQTTTSTASATLGICIYDDRGWSGYPQSIYADLMGGPLTSGTPFTLAAASAGVKAGPTTGAGAIANPADPGLYWLVLKVLTAGTSVSLKTLKGPSDYVPQVTTTGLSITGGHCGYKLTGQGAGALPSTFPSAGVLSDNAPYIGIKYA